MTVTLQAQTGLMFALAVSMTAPQQVLTEVGLHVAAYLIALQPVRTAPMSAQVGCLTGQQRVLTEIGLHVAAYLIALQPVRTALMSAQAVSLTGPQTVQMEPMWRAVGFSKALPKALMGGTCVGVAGAAISQNALLT